MISIQEKNWKKESQSVLNIFKNVNVNYVSNDEAAENYRKPFS
jgi:hypothetical protein